MSGPRKPVSVAPVELGSAAQILAVQTDDERRNEQQRGDRREAFHDLVLIVRDLSLVKIPYAGQKIAGEIEPVGCAQQLVVRIGEVQLGIAREQRDVAVDLDTVVEHRARGIARRREDPPHVQDVVTGR